MRFLIGNWAWILGYFRDNIQEESSIGFTRILRKCKDSIKIWFFQAEHDLYIPGLDENRCSSDFVHDIWICYKLQ